MKATLFLPVAIAAVTATVTQAFVLAAHAQTFPVKPIRIVVPVAPGGNLDIVARALAVPMSETFGHQIIVESRPGASSLVGTQFVARSPADGYTLLTVANTFATVPSLLKNPGYDALRDIVITKVPFIMTPFRTNGVASHEAKYLGAQRYLYGDGGIDWASDCFDCMASAAARDG